MGAHSTGHIVSYLKQDALESWGSDCASSLVAPLLGHDSGFDTTSLSSRSETPGRTGEALAPPSTSTRAYGYTSAASVNKCSRPAHTSAASAVPQIANDNEAPLSTPRQQALQQLSRTTIYGARPLSSEFQGQAQSEALCESIQGRRRSHGWDAGSIKLHGMQIQSGSCGESSRPSASELELDTAGAGDKATNKEFLNTPYNFSMSRAFKFSDGSKIRVSLERSL